MIKKVLWFLFRQALCLQIAGILTLPMANAPPLLRASVLFGVFSILTLILENSQLRRNLHSQTATLKEHDLAPPPRLEERLWGRMFWIGAAVVEAIALVSFLLWAGTFPFPLVFGLEYALVLLSSVLALRLFVGGITQVRYWLKTRRMQKKKPAPSAFPFVTSVGVFCLLLIMFMAQSLPEDELLVTLEHHSPSADLIQLLEQYDIPLEYAAPSASLGDNERAHNTIVARSHPILTEMLLLELGRLGISDVERNPPVTQTSISTSLAVGGPCPTRASADFLNDPLSGSQEALLSYTSRQLLTTFEPPQYPARLAVIDTGVDGHHGDLKNIVLNSVGSVRDSHGTSVAGVAAAITNNYRGIASTNERGSYIEILDIPALTKRNPSADDIAEALYLAADLGATVVVMAFEGSDYTPEILTGAVEHLHSRDIILVAAAGNKARSASQWPANLQGVLVVTGLDGELRASFSSFPNTPITVGAPAVNICAPVPGDEYHLTNGTSMSAAIVAGAIARRRAQCPFETRVTILNNLLASSPANLYGEHPVNLGDFLIKRCE